MDFAEQTAAGLALSALGLAMRARAETRAIMLAMAKTGFPMEVLDAAYAVSARQVAEEMRGELKADGVDPTVADGIIDRLLAGLSRSSGQPPEPPTA